MASGSADPARLLLGPISLDLYRDGTVIPGGGALNMAWHWRQAEEPFTLLTRVGADYAAVALAFLDRHRIGYLPGSIVGTGPSATIDIEILPDGQPHMDRFVEGVWADFRTTAEEEALIAGPGSLHVVLVEGAIAELARLADRGLLARRLVTADFLGFRHYTPERFAATMRAVDVGFVGWPGGPDDPTAVRLGDLARDRGRCLVVTFGSQGVRVVDGRPGGVDHWVDVTPLPVRGTTVGCGDAYIAWFLAEYGRSGDLVAAAERGRIGGALATAWQRPLPDEAY
jgi:sugar/nucleoside kinase (ribokinase family)